MIRIVDCLVMRQTDDRDMGQPIQPAPTMTSLAPGTSRSRRVSASSAVRRNRCGPVPGRATGLAVSHAFHSPLMEPIVTDLRDELDWLEPRPAEFPLFSTVLGRQIDGTT